MSTFNAPATVTIPAQTVGAQIVIPVQIVMPAQTLEITVSIDLAALSAALSGYMTTAAP
jgi:hypothetical protein